MFIVALEMAPANPPASTTMPQRFEPSAKPVPGATPGSRSPSLSVSAIV
jgi:hypothetical protein